MAAKVLLLEEDATYAQELSRGLMNAGCEVILVRDGEAGFARATSEKFDILVVSAELPGVNGFRLCKQLRKDPKTNGTPIILMGSGRTVGFEEHQKLPSRANGYLRKPVDVAELVAMLERIRSPKTVPPPPVVAKPVPRRPPPLPRPSFVAALDQADISGAAVAALRRHVQELEQQIEEMRKGKGISTRPPAPEGSLSAKTELSLREQIHKKERELVELQSSFDAEKHAAIELRQALATAETQIKKHAVELREKETAVARAERLAQAAQTDKDQARKRAEDAAKRLERHVADVERLNKELAAAKADKAELEKLRKLAPEAEKRAKEERASREKLEAKIREIEQALETTKREMVGERASLVEKLERAQRAAEEAEIARADADARLARDTEAVRAELGSVRSKLNDELRKLRASEQDARAALDRKVEELTRAEEQYSRHVNDLLHEQRASGKELSAKLTEARAERDQTLVLHAKKYDTLRAEHTAAVAARAAAEQRAAELVRANADLTSRLAAESARAFQLAEEARTSSHRTLDEQGQQRAQLAADLASLQQQLAQATKLRSQLEKQLATARAERDAVAALSGEKQLEAEKLDRQRAERLRETEERLAHAEESLKVALEQAREATALRSTIDLMREQHAQELDSAAKAKVAAVDTQRIAALEQQNADLSKALKQSRENLDYERRNRLEEEAQTMGEMDKLEATLAGKEAELVRVRAEAKAALDQLEADRTLIAQAKTVLAELSRANEE